MKSFNVKSQHLNRNQCFSGPYHIYHIAKNPINQNERLPKKLHKFQSDFFGILCLFHKNSHASIQIAPHEQTLSDSHQAIEALILRDRTNLPPSLWVSKSMKISTLATAASLLPKQRLPSEDGLEHSLMRITCPTMTQSISNILEKEQMLMIADGHHRYHAFKSSHQMKSLPVLVAPLHGLTLERFKLALKLKKNINIHNLKADLLHQLPLSLSPNSAESTFSISQGGHRFHFSHNINLKDPEDRYSHTKHLLFEYIRHSKITSLTTFEQKDAFQEERNDIALIEFENPCKINLMNRAKNGLLCEPKATCFTPKPSRYSTPYLLKPLEIHNNVNLMGV